MSEGVDPLVRWVSSLLPGHPELAEEFAKSVAESPDRIADAYRELFAGYAMTAEAIVRPTVLLPDETEYKGAVVVRDVFFLSFCAHHFLPFFGQVDLAYEPGRMIVGLGKMPRLVDLRSRRLQIQEFLARDLVSDLMTVVGARGAFVEVTARHLCVCARGPAQQSSTTVTSYRDGSLRHWATIPRSR